MQVKKIKVKGNTYYQLYEGNRFIKHIGNEAAYQKYLKDVEKKERDLEILKNGTKVPTPDMPTGKFDVIYADPPWRYDFDVESRATAN